MRCTRCNKDVEKTTADELCFDCEYERTTAALERDRKTITVEQLIDAISGTDDADEIMDLFTRCQPPNDKLEQAKARERILRALRGKKLSSPTKLVDAWIGSASERDDVNATQASMLVNLVLEREAVLFHTADQQAFAAVIVQGHREVMSLRSRAFRLWLARAFYEATGEQAAKLEAEADASPDDLLAGMKAFMAPSIPRVPGAQALSDAIATLEGMALFGGQELPVYVRVAHVGEIVYLDLGDETWRGVEISRSGWKIVDTPPVMFRRPAGLGALPEPEPGGSVNELREFVNVEDAEWPLLIGGILGLLSRGPYVVIVLLGEQGSAKSTGARVVRALVDPNTAPLRRKPRSDHDLAIAANNAWVISLDNLSSMPVWLSDAICTLATGGGFATRQLYTDDAETLFDSMRPVVLNGIGTIATRSDLLDRAELVTMPVIKNKVPESEFWPRFEAALPRILGALLDAVAEALANVDGVVLAETPRMVDFARWVEAGARALDLEPGAFLDAYITNRRDADLTAIEASVIGKFVVDFVTDRGSWSGSATDLLQALCDAADEAEGRIGSDLRPLPAQIRRAEGWPKQPNSLAHDLRLLAPNLRRIGIEVAFEREGRARTRLITLRLVGSTSTGDLAEGLQKTVHTVHTVRPGTDQAADDADDADDEIPTLGEAARMDGSASGEAPPEVAVDHEGNELHVGDVVRQYGGMRGRRFRVHAIEDDTVHACEIEIGGTNGEQRSFRPGDLVLVERGES